MTYSVISELLLIIYNWCQSYFGRITLFDFFHLYVLGKILYIPIPDMQYIYSYVFETYYIYSYLAYTGFFLIGLIHVVLSV